MINTSNKKNIYLIIFGTSLLLIGLLTTYAFFQTPATGQNEVVNVKAGDISLIFSDGNNGINAELNFGEQIVKSFTIENTGTIDTWAKINFNNLLNTYIQGSLTYTLSYSDKEDGEYINIVTDENIPRSDVESIHTLANSLLIPSKVKYFYKLTITLNDLENIDQTADINAIFSTHFNLEKGQAKYTVTFIDGIGDNTTKEVTEGTTYGDLPTPEKEGSIINSGYFL